MDIEFHYHITYILARKGGFDAADAERIAYACQYTDDNNDKYSVTLGDGSLYENYISQTLNILRAKNKLVRIYTCFHFLPGDFLGEDARRVDGALHLFNTTPDSPDAHKMFRAALDTGDVYRIGIATHCYSDTWAHQNFVGFKHAFGEQDSLLAKATPTIGHADFQHQPDIPSLEWADPRLMKSNSTISNKKRFLLAARAMFMAFAEYNGLEDIESQWADLAEKLGQAIGDACADVKECDCHKTERLAAYQAICPEMPVYDDNQWLEKAVEPIASFWKRAGNWLWRKASAIPQVGSFAKAYWPKCLRVRRFRAREGFDSSSWFRFQQAVKAHQKYVMDLHDDRYQQIGAALLQRL